MVNTRLDSVLARKLNTFLPLSSDELECLAEIQSTPLTVERGKHLVREGQTGHKAFVLQAGWACSYKDLANGIAPDHLVPARRRLRGAAEHPSAYG